jgi:hypothetical protein
MLRFIGYHFIGAFLKPNLPQREPILQKLLLSQPPALDLNAAGPSLQNSGIPGHSLLG